MLRYLVLILFILNAAFLAWSQGWLKPVVGVQPDAQHETIRLQQQLHADRVLVLSPSAAHAEQPTTMASAPASAAVTPDDAASAASSAPNPAGTEAKTLCLQAGPFAAEDMAQVSDTLNSLLPSGAWRTQSVSLSGSWLVYMGPFADNDVHERKLNELRHIKDLDIEEVNAPPRLAQGLSLGRYNSLQQAMAGLAALKGRGVRTARIVVEHPEAEMQEVRIAAATTHMQSGLARAKWPQGQGFSVCRP
jgi:hypothetical protein